MAYSVADDFGSYWVGDKPFQPVAVTVQDSAGNPVDLTPITSVEAVLTKPNGAAVPLTASKVGNAISITLPLLDVAGIATVVARLIAANGSVQLQPERFLIEEFTGWHTLESARNTWEDAGVSDVRLFELLETARIQCETYAPKLAPTVPVPVNYRNAQIMQARNLWNSHITSPEGLIGAEGFTNRPYPMDRVVQGLLRPQSGVPVIA